MTVIKDKSYFFLESLAAFFEAFLPGALMAFL
jgi:hypothetical protein